MDRTPDSFTVMATGQLESAEIPNCDNAYCKYQLVHGEDWQLLDGLEEGITQLARNASGPDRGLVWNFPLDVTYRSTNAFGWPQIIVSVYGTDAWRRDGIQGHTLRVRLFRPRSATLAQDWLSWMVGMPAEFADAKFPSYGEGREVTRVASGGVVALQLNVMTKDMELFGYNPGTVKTQANDASVPF